MLLRVILSPQDIRKIRLDSVPKSVEDLKLDVKNKLQLNQCFDLQYEDTDFKDFCNLTCVDDLSKDKATLKAIFCPDSAEPYLDSCSSDLTLSASSSTSTSSSQSVSFSGRSQHWPTVFPVPTFSFDVELRLRQGNEIFESHGKLLTLSKDMKSEILDKMAETMFSFKAYPANEDFEKAAHSLVEKHPCLKEPGSTSGWYGWKISLKFKMGNYRQKLRDAGCQELKINSDKRGSGDTRGRRNKVKKTRRSETNFLPDLPQGRDIKKLDEERMMLSQEMAKAKPNLDFIDSGMNATFALRRKEIVEEEPPVVEMKARWSALFTERQVCFRLLLSKCIYSYHFKMYFITLLHFFLFVISLKIVKEFTRLMSVDINSFYEGLDGNLQKLLLLYRSKRFEGNKELMSLLESLDNDPSNLRKRTAVLLGLPWYMKENPFTLLKICEPTDAEDDLIKGIVVGILVLEDVSEPLPSFFVDVAIVLEANIVIRHLRDLPNAFMTLMGLMYVLNLNYPKDMKYTFEVIQRLFMGLGIDSCSARVHSLKNALLK
nr:sterile alpha motif domain-containing protein 3-like isoform X1 [Nothobranchius furzeri]